MDGGIGMCVLTVCRNISHGLGGHRFSVGGRNGTIRLPHCIDLLSDLLTRAVSTFTRHDYTRYLYKFILTGDASIKLVFFFPAFPACFSQPTCCQVAEIESFFCDFFR